MDRLGTEVLYMIAAHLQSTPRQKNAPYAILSRHWQHVLERHNFEFIRLKSTELATFASIYSDARRQALLQRLDYSVSLPTYGDSRCNHATNLRIFQSAVRNLLVLLKSWETDVSNNRISDHGQLELRLDVCFEVDHREGPAEFHFDVLKSSANSRYLTFNTPIELSKVHRVTSFAIEARPGLAPHPTATCQIVAALPGLQNLDLEYLDPVNKHKIMRKEHRLALAVGLKSINLPNLKRLRVGRYTTTEPYNHSYDCGNLEENGVDPLSDAIRSFAQSYPLTELQLDDVLISIHLFRNPDTDALSVWPELRSFTIKTGLVSPSGRWYYAGDPGAVEEGSGTPYLGFDDDSEGSVDSDASSTDPEDDADRDAVVNGTRPTHEWRTRPDPDMFDPLVESMADVVTRMPKLQRGTLEIGVENDVPAMVIFKCADAGQAFIDSPDQVDDMQVRRCHVWVGAGTEWSVPKKIESKWKTWLGSNGKMQVCRYPHTS